MGIGQEVSGASRRGPGLRDLGGESEVREDLANDAGVLDGGEQPQPPATARAGEDGCSHRHSRLLMGDGAAAPARVRGENAVVDHEIDAGAWKLTLEFRQLPD